MIVCRKCKKEMNCITNGVQVRYGDGSHAYAGDEFRCSKCGDQVVVTNGLPWQDTEILNNIIQKDDHRSLTDDEYNIWMDK